MDRYKILVKTYMRMYFRYPLGIFLKMVYLPIQMLMYIFLWSAISKYGEIDLRYMICYYLLAILLGYAFPFAHIAGDVQQDVIEGSIVNYMVRPVSYMTPLLAKYMAWMICYSIVFVPTLGFVIIYHGCDAGGVFGFIVFFLLGAAIEFLTWYNIGLLSMKWEKNRGFMMMMMAARTFVSGSLIPLSFFPEAIRKVLEILPFRIYIYTTIDTLLNGTEMLILGKNICFALLWILALYFLCQLQWNVYMKKYQVNVS